MTDPDVATATGPTLRTVWLAARAPLAVAALVVVAAFVVAVVSGQGGSATLDPGSTSPDGAQALATLLRDQGVTVQASADPQAAASAAPGSTVLVAFPERVSEETLARIATTGADVVVVAPRGEAVGAAAAPVREVGSVPPGTVAAPGCALDAATRAGRAQVGGVLYTAGGRPGCYSHGTGSSLVVIAGEGHRVAVLGDATPLTNAHLAQEGNAALATGLLGRHDHLLWLLPAAVGSPTGGGEGVGGLVPAGVRFGLVQLAAAVVVLALWRARRLGPVVTEPLPVVVRASETVEGRGRLYRRTRARDRAAEELRAASRHRLARALGVPPAGDAASLVATAAAHCSRPAAEVSDILYGTPPHDDAGLVRLADALDALEREVRRS